MQVQSKTDIYKDRKVKYNLELKGGNSITNFRVCADF